MRFIWVTGLKSGGGLGLCETTSNTFAECGAFDHFRQLIWPGSIAARFSTPWVCSPFMKRQALFNAS